MWSWFLPSKADSEAEGVEKHAGVRVRAIPFTVCHACHGHASRLEPALQPPPQRAADRRGAAALVKACCFPRCNLEARRTSSRDCHSPYDDRLQPRTRTYSRQVSKYRTGLLEPLPSPWLTLRCRSSPIFSHFCMMLKSYQEIQEDGQAQQGPERALAKPCPVAERRDGCRCSDLIKRAQQMLTRGSRPKTHRPSCEQTSLIQVFSTSTNSGYGFPCNSTDKAHDLAGRLARFYCSGGTP